MNPCSLSTAASSWTSRSANWSGLIGEDPHLTPVDADQEGDLLRLFLLRGAGRPANHGPSHAIATATRRASNSDHNSCWTWRSLHDRAERIPSGLRRGSRRFPGLGDLRHRRSGRFLITLNETGSCWKSSIAKGGVSGPSARTLPGRTNEGRRSSETFLGICGLAEGKRSATAGLSASEPRHRRDRAVWGGDSGYAEGCPRPGFSIRLAEAFHHDATDSERC